MLAYIHNQLFDTSFFISDKHIIYDIIESTIDLDVESLSFKDMEINVKQSEQLLIPLRNYLINKLSEFKVTPCLSYTTKEILGEKLRLNLRNEDDFKIYIVNLFMEMVKVSINTNTKIIVYAVGMITNNQKKLLNKLKKHHSIKKGELAPTSDINELKELDLISINGEDIVQLTEKGKLIPLW